MNSAIESQADNAAAAPTPDTSRIKALKMALIAVVCYTLFEAFLPLVRVPAVKLPGIVLLLLVIVPTMAFMFLQISLAFSIVKVVNTCKQAVIPLLVFGFLWGVIAFGVPVALHKLHVHHSLPVALMYSVSLDLVKTLVYTFLGIILSVIIRDKNTLLPVAIIAMPIDYIGAMTSIGFTNNMLKAHPGIVNAVAVTVPQLSKSHGISLSPIGLIGPGDAIFLAFYFAIVTRLSLNVRGTFWWMYGLLTASLLAVLTISWFSALAALVPMGIAVIIANWKRFSLTRSEWFAFLYVGIFIMVLVVGFYLYSHTRFAGEH